MQFILKVPKKWPIKRQDATTSLFSGILKQSHLRQKIYLRFVSYLSFSLSGLLFLTQDQINRRFFLIWRILPADLMNLSSTMRAVAIWPNIQPNEDFEDVVDFDLTFFILISLELFSPFQFSPVLLFCLSWSEFWSRIFVEYQVFVYFNFSKQSIHLHLFHKTIQSRKMFIIFLGFFLPLINSSKCN